MNAYETPSSDAFHPDADHRTAAQHSQQTVKPIDRAQLQAAVQSLNQYVAPLLEKIEFVLQDDSDALTVMVIHQDSRQFLRQIPPDEVLRIVETLHRLQRLTKR